MKAYKVSVSVKPEYKAKGRPSDFSGIVKADSVDEALAAFRDEVINWRSGFFCGGGRVQAMTEAELITPITRARLMFKNGWQTSYNIPAINFSHVEGWTGVAVLVSDAIESNSIRFA